MADDIVYFLQPDGTKVSNDPRFALEEQRAKMLEATPNRGDVGVPDDEQKAQTQVEHLANLNSGQPGVGPNAVPEDPEEFVDRFNSGRARQTEDRAKADEAGLGPNDPNPGQKDPVDSNKAVLELREEKAKRAEAARKAAEKAEEPGDPEKPYSEWKGAQLKAEALRRNAERDEDNQLELKGIRKASELAELLEQDDAAQRDAGQS